MANDFEVAVVGSGHNGLIAAAYLARAGKKVLVLERNDFLGGGAATSETAAPGYLHDRHASFHVFIQANPLLLDDELGLLSKFGLRYSFPEAVLSTVFDDGDAITLYRDVEKSCASIARISSQDADVYRALMNQTLSKLPHAVGAMFVPPSPQGVFWSQLDQSTEGQAMMRTIQRSMLEVVDEHFESEKVKIHLLKIAAELLMTPHEGGTGGHVANMAAFSHAYSWAIPIGGSGALTHALVRCLEHYGAEIRARSEVVRIKASSGVVAGVELASGETISANVVIGQIHPWLLGNVVEGIESNLSRTARNTTTAPFSIMSNHYALKESVRFRVPDEAAQTAYMSFVPTSLEAYLRVFDDLQYGDLPGSRLLGAYDHARWDSTRAPAGGGTLTLLGFCPYSLRNGGVAAWDERRDELRTFLPSLVSDLCSNLTPENIVGSSFQTPLDAERFSPTFQSGDVCGLGKAFYQSGGHRPTPELSQYTVPGIDGLYLAGAWMHPAGGITGGGRATAIRICGDLGINFDSLRRTA